MLSHIYLGAVAFGVTLLVASLFFHGGKDIHHGHDTEAGLAWAPFASIRFWVFFFAFGGVVDMDSGCKRQQPTPSDFSRRT